MTKIMILDDEAAIRGFVLVMLKRHGFEVIEASTGEEALKMVKKNPGVAIALLDVMLPGIDGFEVCRQLRSEYPSMGIIMLTARGLDRDKVEGLGLGADDYIVKPFSPSELIARVQALWRRMNTSAGKPPENDTLSSGPFTVRLNDPIIHKNARPIVLTARELSILAILVRNSGRSVSRDELLNQVWGRNYIGDLKVVDVNVRRLREKIEDDPANPEFIETVWGLGYRWRGDEL